MTFYREISVWERRATGQLVRYRCLELLPEGGFCVQSADFYRPGHNWAEQDRMLTQQFIELLVEDSPERRSRTYTTLREAIERHQQEFGDA
jgi:hypothetical protein